MYYTRLLSREGEHAIISTLRGFTINLFVALIVDDCVCPGGGEVLGSVKLRQETIKYDLKTSFPSEFCVPHGNGASHHRISLQVSGKELLNELRIHWTVCNTLPKYENITL